MCNNFTLKAYNNKSKIIRNEVHISIIYFVQNNCPTNVMLISNETGTQKFVFPSLRVMKFKNTLHKVLPLGYKQMFKIY